MAFEPFLAYSASAGSGKTYTLTVRYVSLLFLDQSPATILTATFTNKAAAEMRERIVDALRTFGEDSLFLQKVGEETGLSEAELLAKKETVFRRFLRTPNHIVTMDAFFAFVLRSAAFEIGLEPDFETKEVREEGLDEHFLDEAYRASLLEALVRLSIDIEDKRFRKLFAVFEELYRLDPLLPQEAYPLRAKEEIEARIEALRLEMLRRLEAAGASKSAVATFSESDIEAFVKKPFFEKASLADHQHYKKPLRSDATLDVLYGELKEAVGAWYRLKEGAILHYLFALYTHFKNAAVMKAKESKRLSFDDVSYFTYRLLHHTLSKEFLYFKLDTRFRHILLDEFQDTSTLQFLMLKSLIDEMFAGRGQNEFRSFFYVGDTKQSLYRFRGGVEALFDSVAARYGMKVAHLDVNYRSSKAVVETVNVLFSPVMEGFVPQRTKPNANEGFVEVVESDEVISEAVAQARRLMQRGADPSRIAFLVHTNKEGAALQEACEHAEIPTVLQTRSSLRYVPIVAALAAGVRYLGGGNPLDIEVLCEISGVSREAADLTWFDPAMTPLETIDRLVVTFKVFDGDANVLRLLEFAAKFETIEAFLEEFEEATVDVASRSLHGARIMTVHGSKGLEFDYVILLDRTGKGAPDTSPLLYAYDEGLHIERIFYRMKGREHVDAAYARTIEAQKEASAKDRLNVLYVALTRAAEGMVIVKKPEKSIFDTISLVPMRRGTPTVVARPSNEAEVEEVRVPPMRHYGAQHIENRTQEAHDAQAVRFGTALHYALEMLASFSSDAVEEAIEAMRNRYGRFLSETEIDSVRRRIEMLIDAASFQRLLRGAKVHKEVAFVENGEFRRIDLLLEYETGAYVVDYKSAYAQRGDYRAQVHAYVCAAERFLNKPTGGALLYLEQTQIRIEEIVPLNIS